MFDIEGGKIKLSADTLAIPPFKKHYEEAKDKAKALKEIEYIVWRYKWNTPYLSYPSDVRTQQVAKDVFDSSTWEESQDIKALATRFIEFQTTTLIRLYNAAEEGTEFLIKSLEELKADMEREGELSLIDKLKITAGVSKLLKDVEPTAKSLESAKKRAMAEQVESGRVKGGGVIGLYEIPR